MNTRFRLPIVALCVAFVLAGCGSVTQGIKFAAPAGWTGTPAMFGRLQMWVKPAKAKGEIPELIILAKGDPKTLKGDFSDVPPQYAKDVKVLKQGQTKICNASQQADQFIGEGSDKGGTKTEIETISTTIDKERYVATYIRPESLKAAKEAEAAIHSLCPAST